MRANGTRGSACRVLAACVATAVLTGAPAVGSGQDRLGQARPNELDVRDMGLVFEAEVTADARPAQPIGTGIAATVPRGYALVIGVGEYPNLPESLQLSFAESDAEAMYDVLISHEGGAFPLENVRMLVGERASIAAIRRELEEWLPSVARPQDRVVVYFAGHGFVKDGRGYLAPSDVDLERIEDTAYPMAELGDVMANRVQALHKVLFTDACHSGKINPETTNELLHQELRGLPGDFLTLTAATERESSYGSPDLATGFGFFTYFLTRAFAGYADLDPCDGRITAHELIEYVRGGVVGQARRERARRDRARRERVRRDRDDQETLDGLEIRDTELVFERTSSLFQTPTARGDYDPEMLLGVNTQCLADEREERPVGTAVVEANLDDVALYIDGQLAGSVNGGESLRIVGLPAGYHEFEGVRAGYEPDTKDVLIRPGQEVAVTIRIRHPLRARPEARRLFEQGERLLYTRRSSVSLWNLLPVTRTQSRGDLERARDLFIAALRIEPAYVEAARELGHVYHLLGDRDAAKEAYECARVIDPANVEVLTQLAAVLMEYGDPQRAIGIFREATNLEGATDLHHGMLARLYLENKAWEEAVGEARRAIELNPESQQAHLWKADALRMLADGEKTSSPLRAALFGEARDDYRRFLDLTTFESSFGRKLLFFFGVAARVHADREEAYRKSRSSGFLGLCMTEIGLGNPRRARGYCERAIDYREDDLIAHFMLGRVNVDLFNDVANSCEFLREAARGYRKMLDLGPNHKYAKHARIYLGNIAALMPQAGCSGA